MTDEAQTKGGSNSLQRESKVGAMVQLAVSALIGAGLAFVAGLDTSAWSGWAGQVGAGVVAAAGGLYAAYKTSNG